MMAQNSLWILTMDGSNTTLNVPGTVESLREYSVACSAVRDVYAREIREKRETSAVHHHKTTNVNQSSWRLHQDHPVVS
jgi:hypothetical protein